MDKRIGWVEKYNGDNLLSRFFAGWPLAIVIAAKLIRKMHCILVLLFFVDLKWNLENKLSVIFFQVCYHKSMWIYYHMDWLGIKRLTLWIYFFLNMYITHFLSSDNACEWGLLFQLRINYVTHIVILKVFQFFSVSMKISNVIISNALWINIFAQLMQQKFLLFYLQDSGVNQKCLKKI